MKSFWYFFYNLIILPLLTLIFYLWGFFNSKIKDGIKGRKNLFDNLKNQIKKIDGTKTTVWFHSSSLGEFEQAKPIIEKLKHNLKANIVVSFFSPSGYNNSVNYPYADVITYIPLDTVKNSQKFIKLIQPDKMIFMQYDYWPNMIWELKKQKIPVYIIDAKMDKQSTRKLFFIKQFHISLFSNFTKILTISEDDRKSFMDFNMEKNKIITIGDTRFDRVYSKSKKAKEKNLLSHNITYNKKIIVLGSTWSEDEKIIIPPLKKILIEIPEILIIFAPHEPKEEKIRELEHRFHNQTIRFSNISNYNNEKIILIDSVGILSTLYYYAHIAFVGGSFKQKIHNVLEPAVYGIPVLFGPKYRNSKEAMELIEEGCGIEIKNENNMYFTVKKLLNNETKRKHIGKISENYIKQNIGVTDKIITEIFNDMN